LEKDPAYVALQAKRDKAQAVIDQAHAPPVVNANGDDPVKLTDDDINAAVKDHQDAALAIIDLQKHAEENDPNIAVLKQNRTEANAAAEQQYKSAKDSLATAAAAQRQAEEAAIRAKSKTGGR
jgi:hypothetical protein